MDTLKRLARQFLLPFAVACAWTVWSLGREVSTWGLKDAVAHFASSFFISSWAVGQFVRVRNQTHVEHNLSSIESRISSLLDRLDATAKDLIAYITGQDSYCCVEVFPQSATEANVFAENIGQHPIYDVQIRIVNLALMREFSTPRAEGAPPIEKVKQVSMMAPGIANSLGKMALNESDAYAFNIFFFARNGSYVEELRVKRVAGQWRQGIRIRGRDDEMLFERIDHPSLVELF